MILGIIASIVLHLIVNYRMLRAFDGFTNKWIAGWIGAWLGSPVLGHWGPGVAHVYVIPALLGAFIGAFAVTSIPKAVAQAQQIASMPQTPATPLELKKVS
ncbi:MAG TPA: GlsB/YeaQ/YmgE family stress response membrane protein [Candidatus Methylomirabilis sp.]|nr:GlsB/YeaQ/YmgE family stress response membrane protein [Candidatus Methylomirabilis sp.]